MLTSVFGGNKSNRQWMTLFVELAKPQVEKKSIPEMQWMKDLKQTSSSAAKGYSQVQGFVSVIRLIWIIFWLILLRQVLHTGKVSKIVIMIWCGSYNFCLLPPIVCLSTGGKPVNRIGHVAYLFTPISHIDMQILASAAPLPPPLLQKKRERKSVIKIQVMYSCFWILFKKRY